jgi:hypothetical protein
MIGIADDLDRPPIFDGHAHRTGIRAIVRADRTGEFSRSIHRRSVQESGKRWGNPEFYYVRCLLTCMVPPKMPSA